MAEFDNGLEVRVTAGVRGEFARDRRPAVRVPALVLEIVGEREGDCLAPHDESPTTVRTGISASGLASSAYSRAYSLISEPSSGTRT